MDEIETGFEKLIERIGEVQGNEAGVGEKIKKNDAKLLARMAISSVPVVKLVGLNMLRMGKTDTKGELYDPLYYPIKMIILGKTDPSPFRPDDPQKKVIDQFCVLSEEGKFYELMYSFDGFLTDSYLNPIDATQAIEHYGYDVVVMLYRAMHDYLKGEEALLDALEKVMGYIFTAPS